MNINKYLIRNILILIVVIAGIAAVEIYRSHAMQISSKELKELIGNNEILGGSVFNSAQVGSTPVNGYYLQTNGSFSTWAAVSASGAGTISTSSIPTIGNIPYWTSAGYPSLLGTVATTSLTVGGSLVLSQPVSVIGGAASALSLNMANANSWTALQTFTNASTTLFSSSYASSTLYYGANLSNCTGKLLWSNGQFSCGSDSTGTGGAGTISTSSSGVVSNLLYFTSAGAWPETVAPVATTSLTGTAPIVFSQPISVIGAAGSAVSCTAASGSAAGCLSAANWNSFNNKWDLASSTIGAAYGGTGLISPTAGYFLIGGTASALQATSTVFISSTGSLGIGDLTPDANLEIVGTFMVSSAAANDGDRFIVNSSGNIGIGSSTPWVALGIINPNATHGVELTGVNGVDTGIYRSSYSVDKTFYREWGRNNSTGAFEIRRSQGAGTAVTDLTINTLGKWGIGTSTPYANVTIWGSSNTTGNALEVANNASTTLLTIKNAGYVGIGTTSPFGLLAIEQGTETNSLWIGNTGSSSPSLVVKGTNGNGLIGIGTSTPAYSLDLYGSMRIDPIIGHLYIPANTNPTVSNIGDLAINSTNASTSIRFATSTSGLETALYPDFPKVYPYASSTLAYIGGYGATGTSTISWGCDYRPETILYIKCKTDTGTAFLQVGSGTASTTQTTATIACSTTGTPQYPTSNNTFAGMGTACKYFGIGTQAGNPNVITLSLQLRQDAD